MMGIVDYATREDLEYALRIRMHTKTPTTNPVGVLGPARHDGHHGLHDARGPEVRAAHTHALKNPYHEPRRCSRTGTA